MKKPNLRVGGLGRRLPGFSVVVQALFIQLVAFPVSFSLCLFLSYLVAGDMPVWFFAIAQGLFSAGISYFRAMRVWWLCFQFLFPFALLLLLALRVSPLWYLLLFFILLILFWGAVVTRVPLYLSSRAVWEKVAELIPGDRPIRFLDAGCGIGGVVLHLARVRPDCLVAGIEISPLLWLVARWRVRLSGSRARIILGNYENQDLSAYDVVFAYLSPLVMSAFREKVCAEMRPGGLLLSLAFPVEGVEADIQVVLGHTALYGWYVRQAA
ncbi:MAG: class I SAM-dependent methyltransferase [Burkholderiaceae bacterium]|jgi:SAM-dependent methyltransferase|nr:class I SAM-dependent methyltransferase [Burkholderiaceae bacterium]